MRLQQEYSVHVYIYCTFASEFQPSPRRMKRQCNSFCQKEAMPFDLPLLKQLRCNLSYLLCPFSLSEVENIVLKLSNSKFNKTWGAIWLANILPLLKPTHLHIKTYFDSKFSSKDLGNHTAYLLLLVFSFR